MRESQTDPDDSFCTEQSDDWAAWLDEYGSRLLLYARQQTRCEADAEDVLQEAVVQLVKAVHRGDFEGGLSHYVAYAMTAIRHLAINCGRKYQIETTMDNNILSDMLPYEDLPWFASSMDNDAHRQHLEGLLRTILPEYAEVLILRIWGERTFREIAQITGVRLSTVYSRYRIALRKVGELLDSNPLP